MLSRFAAHAALALNNADLNAEVGEVGRFRQPDRLG